MRGGEILEDRVLGRQRGQYAVESSKGKSDLWRTVNEIRGNAFEVIEMWRAGNEFSDLRIFLMR